MKQDRNTLKQHLGRLSDHFRTCGVVVGLGNSYASQMNLGERLWKAEGVKCHLVAFMQLGLFSGHPL